MIKNERQYRITRAQAERFEEALASLAGRPHPASILERAQQDAVMSQLADLRAEIADYDALKSGRETVLISGSIDDLPQALIKARIAAGLTQKDLAVQLGMKEQQIQKYEATEYASASLSRLRTIVKALGARAREQTPLGTGR